MRYLHSVLEGAGADDIMLPQYLLELSISMMDEVNCVNSRIFTRVGTIIVATIYLKIIK